ncbi:MAG: hypothetical protein ACOYJV_01565 [Aminivibrio sp.]
MSDLLKDGIDRLIGGSRNVCIHKPENIEDYKIETAPDGSLVHSVKFFDGKEAVMVFKDQQFVSCKYGPEAQAIIRKEEPDRTYLL